MAKGNYSRDTFRNIKHYVGVRLQQGVPLLDADWNEQDDIRKYEVQTFIKWFIGDGIPFGNNGFKISPNENNPNDFIIQSGRCLVDGWEVINEEDCHYIDQEDVLALEPPQTDNRVDLVYLDVWEREVDAEEDEYLINKKINEETCIRLKREWRVRVEPGTEGTDEPPSLPETDDQVEGEGQEDEVTYSPPPNARYELAHLKRTPGNATIEQDQIIDLRRTGLTLASCKDQLDQIDALLTKTVADAFGESYTPIMDESENLRMNLRDAINGILDGSLQGTASMLSGHADGSTKTIPVEGINGDVWIFWSYDSHILYDTYHRDSRTWIGETTIEIAGDIDPEHFITLNAFDFIWLFFHKNSEVWYKRYSLANGRWDDDETQLDVGAQGSFTLSGAICDGERIWLYGEVKESEDTIDIYYIHGTVEKWDDSWHKLTEGGNNKSPCAVADNIGNVWMFWRNNEKDLLGQQYRDDWEDNPSQILSGPIYPITYGAVADHNGNIFVAYREQGSTAVRFLRYLRDTATWDQNNTNIISRHADGAPLMISDTDNGVWIFGVSSINGIRKIVYNYYSTRRNGWWASNKLLDIDLNMRSQASPLAIACNSGDIWVTWQDPSSNDESVWYRRMTIPI